MKRLFFTLIFLGAVLIGTNAQTAPVTATQAKVTKKSTGVTKSGKPDMRLKANKEAAKAQAQQPAAPAPAPVPKVKKAVTAHQPAVAPAPRPAVVQPARPAAVQRVQPSTASADPVVGTDAKGRTIYRGKRGGTYYINKNGNKEYIKQ